MRYVYHYHATFNHQNKGYTTNYDGIITCADKVDSHTRYSEIKKAILDDETLDQSKLILQSLVFLHTREDEPSVST